MPSSFTQRLALPKASWGFLTANSGQSDLSQGGWLPRERSPVPPGYKPQISLSLNFIIQGKSKDRKLTYPLATRKRAERKPCQVQALAANPPYFKGLGSLFRSLVSAFQVGYYDRHCTEENPEARQVRTHTHAEQS